MYISVYVYICNFKPTSKHSVEEGNIIWIEETWGMQSKHMNDANKKKKQVQYTQVDCC